MGAHTRLHPGEERCTGRGKPQSVGTSVGASPSLEPSGPLELIEQGHETRTVESDGVCQRALCDTWIGFDQNQYPDPPGRDAKRTDGLLEIAKDGLLRESQFVTEQLRQHATCDDHGSLAAGTAFRGCGLLASLFGIQTI